MKTVMMFGASALAMVLFVVAAPGVAQAQVGNVNPAILPPGSTAVPFGQDGHPFNNFHLRQPWSVWGYTLRDFVVPARIVLIPMEVTQPGSLPPTVEMQTVTIPGYAVKETTRGFVVLEHWGVEPKGSAYYWTWRPTYFMWK